VTDDDDLAAWVAGKDDLFALAAGRFFRVEPRRRARAYVRGLLAPLASSNEHEGDVHGEQPESDILVVGGLYS
jgi:hypothetical protein